MIALLLFITYLILFVYLPGWALIKKIGLKINDPLIVLLLNLTSGLVLVTVITLLRGILSLSWYIVWLLPFISLWYVSKEILEILRKFPPTTNHRIAIILVVIFFFSLLQSLTLFPGTTQTEKGMLTPALHDSMWNISLMNELAQNFPPQHPGFAGEFLKNNHYFYPLFLASVVKMTGISNLTLYYRLGPLLVSVLFGLSLYTVSTIFFKSRSWQLLTIFFGYFSGNLAFVLSLFKGSGFDWKGSTFFADQPFDQLTNPYTVLGFVFVLVAGYLLAKAAADTKNASKWFLVSAFSLGLLFGFKSFAAVLAVPAFFITGLLLISKRKNLRLLLPGLVIFFSLTLISYFLVNEPGKTGLVWAPGWLLTQMMTSADKLNTVDFDLQQTQYLATGNYLRYIIITGSALIIYLVGNLGVRLFGVVELIRFWLWKSKQHEQGLYIFNWYITIFILLGLGIPLLFNLRGSAFNVIQFTPYALLFLVFPMLQTLQRLYQKITSHQHRVIGLLCIVLFIALAIPVNVKNIREKQPQNSEYIPNDILGLSEFIQNNTNPNSIILSNYATLDVQNISLMALSRRHLYLVFPGFAEQTLLDPKPRIELINQVYQNGNSEALTAINPDLVVMVKLYENNAFINLIKRNGTLVYENSSLSLYKMTK
ncbi:hypothetical protein C4579_00510 [Candidatus Microgenomates bacterium]|nr:MAG: hypothetical protein C4579_00510 [Candidatus Microgenomates bacterium]